MGWQKPSPRVVWRAIQTYLRVAYGDDPAAAAAATVPSAAAPGLAPGAPALPAATPSAVRARLDTLRSTPDEAFYDSPVFERPPPAAAGVAAGSSAPSAKEAARADGPVKYALRLGNRTYPHMKLVIDRSPDGQTYLVRADTHDAHCAPRPGSREAAAFAELARLNREVADAIEHAWEEQGLPTFKKFLRDDLERRKAAQG